MSTGETGEQMAGCHRLGQMERDAGELTDLDRPHNTVGPGQRSRYSDLLRAGRSGDRIPVRARFSAPVQTGPGTYPASCTMCTGSFSGVKRQGRGADHPPPSKCRGHERVGLYLYSPSWPQWPVIGRTLPFTLHNTVTVVMIKWGSLEMYTEFC